MDAGLEEGPQLLVLVLKKQVQKADRASEADHQPDTRARGGGRHRSGGQRPRVGAAERPRGRGEGEGRGEVEGEVAGAPGPQRSTPQPDSWLRDGAAPAGRTGGWNPPASFQSCLPTLKQRVAGSPYPPVHPGLPADREPLGAEPSRGLPSLVSK